MDAMSKGQRRVLPAACCSQSTQTFHDNTSFLIAFQQKNNMFPDLSDENDADDVGDDD